jgi:hypothetical protein
MIPNHALKDNLLVNCLKTKKKILVLRYYAERGIDAKWITIITRFVLKILQSLLYFAQKTSKHAPMDPMSVVTLIMIARFSHAHPNYSRQRRVVILAKLSAARKAPFVRSTMRETPLALVTVRVLHSVQMTWGHVRMALMLVVILAMGVSLTHAQRKRKLAVRKMLENVQMARLFFEIQIEIAALIVVLTAVQRTTLHEDQVVQRMLDGVQMAPW